MSTVVIDFAMGNLHSVARALERAGGRDVVVSDDPDRLLRADRVVFPGQGAIGSCVAELERRGLREAIVEVATQRPFLGICLGLQALFERSDEDGGVAALGVLPGQVRRFPHDGREPDGAPAKVPHMGWNQVRALGHHPLWRGVTESSWFYFVHSYYVVPADAACHAGITAYAGIEFVSAVARGNLVATQFHPEKSHRDGLKLLENFVAWDGDV